jgi:hypothetical protein
MGPVVAGIALGIAGAVVYRTVNDAAGRMRGWYETSFKNSLWELIGVMAFLGGVIGALYARSKG